VLEYRSVGVMGVASYDTTPSLRYSITPTADFSPWNNFRKQPMKISVKRQAKLVLRYISDLGETAHELFHQADGPAIGVKEKATRRNWNGRKQVKEFRP
jgi:hypothetical protein